MSESLSPLPPNFEDPKNDRRNQQAGIPSGLDAGRRAGDNRTYISFYVAGQLLGIPIEKVQEVLVVQNICHVPLASKSIAGLINLRGQIVTSIDLRERLNLPKREENGDVMNIVVHDGDELFSLMADSVGDVLEVRRDSYEASPPTLDPCWRKCCEGVHRLKKGLMVIIGVSLLLDFEQSMLTAK